MDLRVGELAAVIAASGALVTAFATIALVVATRKQRLQEFVPRLLLRLVYPDRRT